MKNIILPSSLNSIVGNENIEFVVKAERKNQKRKSVLPLLTGIIWCILTSMVMIPILIKLFSEETELIKNNSIISKLIPLSFYIILISFSIYMLHKGLSSLLKKGGYFVGTPTRLISYLNGNSKSINWKEFLGEIEVNGNSKKGNVILKRRAKTKVNSQNSSAYISDNFCMIKIPNPFEIEKICSKRIKRSSAKL